MDAMKRFIFTMPRSMAILACLLLFAHAWSQYGEGPDRVDVTSRLRSMVRDGRISIRVDNRTMGSDPASGRPKILWVTYYAGGQGQRQVKVYENTDLTLP